MMKKLVLTGAAGRLGSYLREPLSKMAEKLVSTDIAEDLGMLYDSETYVQADLAEYDQIAPIMEGADMVVHFGAIVDEKPFPELLGPNFVGQQARGERLVLLAVLAQPSGESLGDDAVNG